MDNLNNKEYLKQLISCYIDGETTAQETKEVLAALEQDAELKKYYEQLKATSSSLQTWTKEELSPDSEQRIVNAYVKAKQEEGDMKRLNTSMRWASSLAVAVIVSVVAVSVGNQYLHRGVQGRLKSAADDVGYQTSAGNTGKMSLQQPAAQPVRDEKLARQSKQFQLFTEEGYADKAGAPVAAVQVLEKKAVDYERTNVAARTRGVHDAMQAEPYYLEADYSMSSVTRGDIVGKEMIYPMIPPPRPQVEQWNREQYSRIYENEFKAVTDNPLSTFSIDVDTASYSNLRRFLNNGSMPPPDAVRIEEMINYFSYDYPEPAGQDPFSVSAEVGVCPWNPDHELMLVGLQGKRLDARHMPASNLTFLLDVSGSMNNTNKLPLLKKALRLMIRQLRPEDRISIVVYAGAAGLVLEPTSGYEKQKILNAIANLNAGGSTAGGAGIKLAYETAGKNYIQGGNNRVILATDGDFNVGVSSDSELVRLIEEKRKQGVFLTVLGFGTGNYQDAKMEQLADKGNGNYYYIDTMKEAKKVLVQELGSMLFTIAKDVKLQIEFNPGQVKAYRLIGYENRVLAKEDFNDDTKDAGELGTGHSVTALYELVPADSKETFGSVDPLKYQNTRASRSDELATIKLRYKKPEEEKSKLLSQPVTKDQLQTRRMSKNLGWAASVAEFGMVLRDSKFKGNATYQSVLAHALAVRGPDKWGFRNEMINLITQAESLDMRPVSGPGGGISTK